MFASGCHPQSSGRLSVLLAVGMMHVGSSLAAAPAPAQITLTWMSPAGCMTLEEGRRSIASVAGRTIVVESGNADFSVEVAIERVNAVWEARVALRDQAGAAVGNRTLRETGESCRDVDKPLTLSLALLIDIQVERVSEARAVAPPPPSPPVQAAVPPDTFSKSVVLEAGAAVVGLYGLVPSASLGVGALVMAARQGWPIAVEGGAVFVIPDRGEYLGGSMELQGWYASLGVCAIVIRRGQWTVEAGGDAVAGSFSVTGRGFDTARTQEPFIAGVAPKLSVRREFMTYMNVQISIGGLVPLQRHHYLIVDQGIEREIAASWPVIPFISVAIGAASERRQ